MHSLNPEHTLHFTTRTPRLAIRSLGFAVMLALLPLLLITGLAYAAPTLDLTVDPGVAEGESVRPGDVVTATVRLAYSGGSGPATTGLLVNLPDGVELAGRPILGENPAQSVDPLEVKRRGATVGWQGRLRNDGTLILQLPLRVARCWDGFRTLTLNAAAQRPDGGSEQANGRLRVHCPLATLDDIHVTQRVVRSGVADWMPYDPGLIPGQGLTLRTTFRNDAPVPVLLGVSRPRLLAVDASQEDAASQRITLLHLAPGESRSVEQAIKPGGTIDPARLLDGDVSLTVGVIYCLVTGNGRACASSGQAESRTSLSPAECGDSAANQPRIPCPDPEQIPDPTGQVTVTIPIHPNDLGDAPDSMNHAGQPMTAYTGVTAHFPTVFAGLPGDAPGPLHRNPRPVHLGNLVSMEAEADSGPDADPTNNLLPGLDTADRDRFDDGVRLATLDLNHCQPARLQAQVWLQNNLAKQALLNRNIQTLYLNVWIDGNRDGDWNDTAACSPQPGDLGREHIVIDHPVSVASLTPGGNLLNVVSSVKSLWASDQTNKAAWLRVTLSEEKSPKLAGRIYGDGRGPDRGYRLGETEDYLWRPPGSADVTLSQSGAWLERPLFEGSAIPGTDRYAQFQITYENQGNDTARDVTIVQDVTGFGTAELVEVHAPGLPASAIQHSDGKLSVYVQEVPSGAQGTILVGWRPQAASRSSDAPAAYRSTVTVTSAEDVDESNNSVSTEVTETSSLHFGFRTANSPVLLTSGLTCRSGVELVGIAPPGAQVRLEVDGTAIQDTLTYGNFGRWGYSLQGLSDGLHVIRGWTDLDDSDPGVMRSVLVRVDSYLPIDPASFAVTDAAGRSFGVGSPVWDDTDIVHLLGGGPFTVGVNACVGQAGVSLGYIGETEKNITLSDPDEDGRFTGVLTLGSQNRSATAVSLSLTATTETDTTIFDLAAQAEAPGVVSDAVTGQPIPGATVALLVETTVPSASGATFSELLLDAGFGQANPQTTPADGSFYYAPPTGVYRLLVSAPGYQPYRTAAVEINDAGVGPAIALTPLVSQEPDVTVTIGPGGFDPGVLTVPPGTVVEWVNGGLAEHSTYAELWDSGVLWPGESFRVRFNDEGEHDYRDGENPLNDGLVTVDPNAPAPGMSSIFLPSITR